MRVEDFMTRRVVTITPDTTLLAAARLMLEHRVGGLPVVDASGRMIGVFSVNDLLRGRIARFSLDALVNIAAALGRRVTVKMENGA